MDQQEQLVEENLRLVYYLVKKNFAQDAVANSRYDDFLAVGMLGLVKAAQTFNEEKQIKFATYASKCIINEILMFLRREDRLRKNGITTISMDSVVRFDGENNNHSKIDFGAIIADSYNLEEEFVERASLQQAIDELPEGDRKLLYLMFKKELKQRDAAEVLGISQSYVSRKYKVAIKRLVESFNK